MNKPITTKKYLRISELSKTMGIPRSTIQFYLREKLLHPPTKTSKTMAYYDISHIDRLEKIKQLKDEQGLPINFIKKEIEKLEILESKRAKEEETISESAIRNKRRQEIIKAAIQIFSKKGYHRATIQEICQFTGISVSSFYLYFKNKRALFIHIVDDVIRTIISESDNAIQKEKTLERKLIARGEAFFENYLQYNDIINQVKAEMASSDQWPRDKVKQIYMDLTDPVVEEIGQMMERGQIRSMDKQLLAYTLTGAIEAACLRVTFDDQYSIRDVLGFLEDLLREGMRKRE